jgi:hypothetical protein
MLFLCFLFFFVPQLNEMRLAICTLSYIKACKLPVCFYSDLVLELCKVFVNSRGYYRQTAERSACDSVDIAVSTFDKKNLHC